MNILKDAETRAEYKRRWKALARAKKHGLNIDLIDAFCSRLVAKQYDKQTIFAVVLLATREGVFGVINNK